ncbi:POK9 protein, partial [Corythaeola cristata]|nr:POK9 protein [Corythaeola cristata]
TGSAGRDVATLSKTTITDSAVRKIPVNAKGPVGHGLSALLLGQLSTTVQGLFVLPGVIDVDFEGQIQAMVWTPSPPIVVPAGARIAQLLPFKGRPLAIEKTTRGTGGFGSTGPAVLWVQPVTVQRPKLTCTLHNAEGKPTTITMTGIIDTGADVTVIS